MYGSRLKSLREDNDFRQKEIADKLGIGLRTYQKYESEEIEPKVSALATLAELYDCTIDYILGRTNHPREGLSEFSIENKKIVVGYDKTIHPDGVNRENLIKLLKKELEATLNDSESIQDLINKLEK